MFMINDKIKHRKTGQKGVVVQVDVAGSAVWVRWDGESENNLVWSTDVYLQ